MPEFDTSAARCDMLVSAAYILTQDADRRVLHNASLAVSGGKITALGPSEDLAGMQAEERLDLGRALIMPGLVNAHTHVSMTLLRGLADDLPLMEWLNSHIWPRERHLGPELVELGALLGCAEMLRTGTTAFMDMYIIEDAVARAVEQSGMRARLGEGIFAFASAACGTPEQAFDKVREQAADYAGHERVRFGVMPHTVYTTTPDILSACAALADELDLPLHMHLSETMSEVEQSLATHGKRPVALCEDLGLLGPGSTFAHCVVLDEDELALLARREVRVAHCPKSNMKLASGVAPVPAMFSAGMVPGLGTDGAASNNSLNMFAEMSACALLHKVHAMDPTVAPAQRVLDMATLGGAQALHWPGLGRLAVGGPADCIALDLDSPNLQPLYSPASHLVYAASGHEVCLTMIDGRVVYRNGRYLTLDYPALLDEVRKAHAWAMSLQ